MAGEQPVVLPGLAAGPAGGLHEGEADGRVAGVQDRQLLVRHQRVEQPVPPHDAVVGADDRRPLPRSGRPAVELRRDLDVLAAAVGVAQLGGQRRHQRRAQRPQVVLARLLVLVEQGVAPRLGVAAVLLDQGPDEPVPVPEVVLHRPRVALARGPVDLPQGDAVDAARGEQGSAARMICSRVSLWTLVLMAPLAIPSCSAAGCPGHVEV